MRQAFNVSPLEHTFQGRCAGASARPQYFHLLDLTPTPILLALRTRTHSCPPSFSQAIFINLCFVLYGRADVANRLTTLRAASATYPQSYSVPSSSTLGTVHTHQSSGEATAEAILSPYSDDRNSWHSTNAHSLFHNNFLDESGSNCGPTSAAYRDSPLSYTIVGREWYRTSAAGQSSCGRLHRDCTPAPSSHDPTQVQSAGTRLPRSSSQSQDSARHDHPSSGVRSVSTSPSGPFSSSLDAPTIAQYPSAAPDRPTSTRSHQSPPELHTQPSKLTSTSLHSHTCPH